MSRASAPAVHVAPQVRIDTAYPHEDIATVTVTANAPSAVHLRMPSWATRATVNGEAAANGTIWSGVALAGAPSVYRVDFAPEIRLQSWDRGAVSVHRGALLYSLPIAPEYQIYAHHFGTDGACAICEEIPPRLTSAEHPRPRGRHGERLLPHADVHVAIRARRRRLRPVGVVTLPLHRVRRRHRAIQPLGLAIVHRRDATAASGRRVAD